MNNNPPHPEQKKKKGAFREYAEAIITAVLIALVIRSFGIEAFKIPSSSMVPTLLVGDHIFVNKFIYGLRIPLTKKRFFEFREPRRGEVIVFIYPQDEGKDFIKRVVGLPGDTVTVDGKGLQVNGDIVPTAPLDVRKTDGSRHLTLLGSAKYTDISFFEGWWLFEFFEQTLDDNSYVIQFEKNVLHRSGVYKVPAGHLFVMGDNRDNSSDSREWGFVPLKNIKGKAMFIWLSFNSELWSQEADKLRQATDNELLYRLKCAGLFFEMLADPGKNLFRTHRIGDWIR